MQGKKNPPETIYAVMAVYAVTGSFAETARKLGVPESTVRDTVRKNKDKAEYAELRAEIQSSFSQDAQRIISKAMARLEATIDDEDKDIPINHLTTAIGTLIDKKRLIEGDSTENTAVTFKLPPGVEEYAG